MTFELCCVSQLEAIKQQTFQFIQTSAIHKSWAVQLILMPKVNGCLISYRRTFRDVKTGSAQLFTNPAFGHLRLSPHFFPLHRGELGMHSVNLLLRPACFYTGFLQNRKGDWKRGSKGREWIKEQEEKAMERARWAPSQSIYQTQCGPPSPPHCSHVLNPHVIL